MGDSLERHITSNPVRASQWAVVCLCCLVLLFSGNAAKADRPVAPDFTLADVDGRPVRLAEVATRQVTVLFFWATWCPYCGALMPHLQSIRLEYGDAVEILAIDVFDDGDPASFLDKQGYDFLLLPDGDEVAASYGVTGTPGVFVLDRDRVVHFDLRELPPLATKVDAESMSNRQRAARLAPYWAAEIRKAIDRVGPGR